jgi:transposase-like protein
LTRSGQSRLIGLASRRSSDLWIEQTEGAKFWMRVMTEIRSRGTTEILIAVVDGLKGFPKAITAVFLDAVVQTCIVHLIRYSMQFAWWKERPTMAALFGLGLGLFAFVRSKRRKTSSN